MNAKTKQKEPAEAGSFIGLDGSHESILFLVKPILLVDLIIRGLDYVAHVELAARDHIRVRNRTAIEEELTGNSAISEGPIQMSESLGNLHSFHRIRYKISSASTCPKNLI